MLGGHPNIALRIFTFQCIDSAEAEFEEKLKKLQEKHKQELAGGGNADEATSTEMSVPAPSPEPELIVDKDEADRLRKQEKARRKKEAKKEKERQRQEDLEKETAEAGPSMRRMELDALETQLKPLSLKIVAIPSDGNCLYRAVAAQCEGSNYSKIRK